MNKYIISVLDYSEVWAMLIPLGVLYFRRNQPTLLKPVIIYLWIGLAINIAIDGIMAYNIYNPGSQLSNNALYNIHTVVRFICFTAFFVRLPNHSFARLKRLIPALSLIFLLINFTFFENFLNFSSLSGNLLSAEAYLLLIYCMLFYLSELNKENPDLFSGPYFWIVTGLSIYLVVNFFVFLFYIPLLDYDPDLSVNMWNIHNIAFIIFCIFIAKAFYVSPRYQHSV